jgi:hypothetical protein
MRSTKRNGSHSEDGLGLIFSFNYILDATNPREQENANLKGRFEFKGDRAAL